MADVLITHPDPGDGGERSNVASLPRSPWLRNDNPWVLALYASTLVLGAGVFVMPAEAERSGVAVTAVVLGIIWFLSRRSYRRQMVVLGDPARGGVAALGEAMAAAGAGPAGHRLALVGVAAYVVPATIGYATIGAKAIDTLASLLHGHPLGGTVLAAAGTWVAVTGADHLDNPLVGRLARQLGTWSAGIAIASYLTGTPRLAASLTVFTLGAWQAANVKATSTERGPRELEQGHLTSIAALGLQTVLMAVLATAAAWTVIVSPDTTFQTPRLIGDIDAKSMLVTIGVLAFALVGTGWTSMHRYRSMADPGFRRKAADASMIIVGLFQLTWMAIILVTISGTDLLGLDNADDTSAQGIADLVSTNNMPGWITGTIALIAAAVVGVGVTGAANGFSESLALETCHTLRRREHDLRFAQPHLIKRAIVAATAILAGIFQTLDINASSVLAIGGLAGGSTLIFILGAIATGPHHRTRARREALTVAYITGTGTIALTALDTPGNTPTRIAITTIATALTLYIIHLTNQATNPNTQET